MGFEKYGRGGYDVDYAATTHCCCSTRVGYTTHLVVVGYIYRIYEKLVDQIFSLHNK